MVSLFRSTVCWQEAAAPWSIRERCVCRAGDRLCQCVGALARLETGEAAEISLLRRKKGCQVNVDKDANPFWLQSLTAAAIAVARTSKHAPMRVCGRPNVLMTAKNRVCMTHPWRRKNDTCRRTKTMHQDPAHHGDRSGADAVKTSIPINSCMW
ncbi:hypothetical protein B296_00046736 [Ensete ventricosum]|uniref:Uncharacterized protein n=1 Tax=Ensete ventricosum TaxID=4639 RepID=A0A426Y4K4_ENSVE|nr:hypothetical protein B296_00046736 [Ensete ventricosum]